jgi:DNA-binding transcriptional MerR regulator
MKTGEAAKLLGTDVSTIRKWIDHPQINRFFSVSAKGEHGSSHRLLTEADILVLNSIRSLRALHNADWGEITTYLDSGDREQEFPSNAISVDTRTIPMPQAQQSAKAMATLAERDAALRRVEELSERVDQLEQEKEELRERLTHEKEEVKEQLMREIMELMLRIGRLEGKLETRDKSE